MSYDGLITGAVAVNLNKQLSDGRIDKIYQPDKDELIIFISANKKKHRLYISSSSSHARMHLIEIEKEQTKPQNPSAFCMLLRKHFQGGRIKRISQIQSERIVEFDVSIRNELGFTVDKRLTVEIMGKHSNIIAIDVPTNKIIDSIKRIPLHLNRYRQILPGQDYIYPPDKGKVCFYSVTLEYLTKIMQGAETPSSEILANKIQGINRTVAEELCILPTVEKIHDAMMTMSRSIETESYSPFVYLDKDKYPIDFHIFPISDKEGALEKIYFDNLNKTIEYYYSHKSSSNRIKQKSADLNRALSTSLDKLYLKNQKLNEDLYAASNSEHFRIYGELLTANIYSIPKNATYAKVLNYYNNEEIEIPLDPRFSISANAQRYFKRYSKSKTALKEKKIQIDETSNTIDYLESVLVYVENANSIEEIEDIRHELVEGGYLRKRKSAYRPYKSKPQPLIFTAHDGSLIYVGRNNKENDYLTFKSAGKKDYWFHAKDIPGSHVVLSPKTSSPTEKSMIEAASLAAYHSKARNSENVAVDYTIVKNVKKIPNAKPGMVTYSEQKTLFVRPIEKL